MSFLFLSLQFWDLLGVIEVSGVSHHCHLAPAALCCFPRAAALKLPWYGDLQRRAGWDEGGLCVAAGTLSQGLCRGSQGGEALPAALLIEHLPLSHALCSKPSLCVMFVVAQTELFRPLPCSQAPVLSISRQSVFNLTFPFWVDLSWKAWKGRAPKLLCLFKSCRKVSVCFFKLHQIYP